MGKTPAAPAPVDPGESALNYVNDMADPELQARLLEVERQFRPEYDELNLQQMGRYLLGTEGTTGALDLFGMASDESARIQNRANTIQRQGDIADVNALGKQATDAFRNANPELQAQLARAQGLSGGDSYAGFRNAVNAEQTLLAGHAQAHCLFFLRKRLFCQRGFNGGS